MFGRFRRRVEVKIIGGKPVEPTSSLNEYFMCICGRKYLRKISLIKHLTSCNGMITRHWCVWCNIEFKNKGNLASHTKHMHGIKLSSKTPPKGKKPTEYKCDGCDTSYKERWRLKYHIRRQHFNLWAKIPHAEAKRVNQVWFEKVQNTNMAVQIQKAGLNKLVIKRTPLDAGIKIHNTTKVIDLHKMYPTTTRCLAEETCKICLKSYRKVDLPKHMNETHYKIAKHKCNNCNMTFKRSYIYLQHVCNKSYGKKRKVTGVKHNTKSTIRISSVASLEPVLID